MLMRLLRHSFTAALILSALSCGGGGEGGGGVTPPPPTDNTPASVSLSPAGAQTVASGTSVTVTATVKAGDGRVLSAGVSWSSSDATIASVSGGVVSGLKTGTATITASAGSVSSSVAVAVTPGSAVLLVLRTQAVGSTVGSVLATQPVVEVRDAAGNLVTTSSATVVASIASGGGALSGQTSIATVAGVATFTNLAIAGAAGDRTLSFSATGLTSAVSGPVTMTPAPVQIIVLDNVSFTLAASRGGPAQNVVVQVTNGGSLAVTGLALNTIYDAGQATGWLSATLNSATAPATITLTVTPGTLAQATYHAIVQVAAPAATNTPQNISVTINVLTGSVVAYGTPAEKVRVVDIGGVLVPTVAVTDSSNRPLPGVPVAFTSRSSSVATVATDGKITALSPGDAWIVASSTTSTDSIFVIVPKSATAPIFRTTSTTWVGKALDTTFVTIVLDGRGTTIGAASLSVGVQLNPQFISNFIFVIPQGPPIPTVNVSTPDIMRVAFGSATGSAGLITVLNLKLVGIAAGASGWLTLLALDVSGIDGSNLTPLVTSTRLPIVLK